MMGAGINQDDHVSNQPNDVPVSSSVPVAGMGHSHAGGEESHQPNVNGESQQEDYGRRGSEAPLDLCTYHRH